MSSCQTNDPCNDPPIGTQPMGATCSPCGEPTEATLISLVKSQQDVLCALKAQMNNWHALLEKVRNRLAALELTVARIGKPVLPKSSVAIDVCNGEEVDLAQSLVVCDGDTGALLPMEECEFPIRGADGITGRPIVTWLAENVLLSTALTANQTFSLDAYEDDMPKCAKFAVCSAALYGAVSTSSGYVQLTAETPSGGNPPLAIASCDDIGRAAFFGLVPILPGNEIKIGITSSGTFSSRTLSFRLHGFV